ncbi:hypothetical protein AB0H76_15410 [Nocardia sp. NPDC050712]|uniref:hypothetical protein n=1 Tax=Nocardia sp. NPDC050712 TaxID=3155518 RepID=UPI0033E69EFA
MTTPNLPTPPENAFVVGYFGDDLNESTIKAIATGGAKVSFSGVQTGINGQIKTPIVQTQAVAVTTGVIGGQTVTRYLYTSGGTWTKPTPASGKRISRIGIAVICGGNGGNGPTGSNGDGSEGGEGGGYLYKEFVDSAVGSSLTVTIGAGGSGGGQGASGTTGGVTSVGSLVVGVPATSNVQTSQGALGATTAPGRGGTGGGGGNSSEYNYRSPGYRGQSTALGVGGAGGSVAGDGSAAGTTGTDAHIFSGGGGGGGGGGSSASGGVGLPSGQRPGGGGAGAAPGGGGGGGGGGIKNSNASWPSGGAGANGGAAIWVYYEEITT